MGNRVYLGMIVREKYIRECLKPKSESKSPVTHPIEKEVHLVVGLVLGVGLTIRASFNASLGFLRSHALKAC